MHELKSIQPEAIPAALEKAERYRLLNQPRGAESICLDVLQADTENRRALVILLLSLTDQFGKWYEVDLGRAREVLERLHGDYERAYYEGVMLERWGKGLLRGGAPVAVATGWLQKAMTHFERAGALRPPDNDEAVLRWNSCARLLNRLASKAAGSARVDESLFVDEIPPA